MKKIFTTTLLAALAFIAAGCSNDDTDNDDTGVVDKSLPAIDIYYLKQTSKTRFPIDEDDHLKLSISDTVLLYIEAVDTLDISVDWSFETVDTDVEGYNKYRFVATEQGSFLNYILVSSQSGSTKGSQLPFYLDVNTSSVVSYRLTELMEFVIDVEEQEYAERIIKSDFESSSMPKENSYYKLTYTGLHKGDAIFIREHDLQNYTDTIKDTFISDKYAMEATQISVWLLYHDFIVVSSGEEENEYMLQFDFTEKYQKQLPEMGVKLVTATFKAECYLSSISFFR